MTWEAGRTLHTTDANACSLGLHLNRHQRFHLFRTQRGDLTTSQDPESYVASESRGTPAGELETEARQAHGTLPLPSALGEGARAGRPHRPQSRDKSCPVCLLPRAVREDCRRQPATETKNPRLASTVKEAATCPTRSGKDDDYGKARILPTDAVHGANDLRPEQNKDWNR